MTKGGITVEVEGLKDLERALDDLQRPAAKALIRRSLMKAAKTFAEHAQDFAPDGDTGDLGDSIQASTKLTKRQQFLHRRFAGDSRSSVEVFVGPVYQDQKYGAFYGHLQEFGTAHHAAQPFMRPAWISGRDQILKDLSRIMREEIKKAIARAERKAARQARLSG